MSRLRNQPARPAKRPSAAGPQRLGTIAHTSEHHAIGRWGQDLGQPSRVRIQSGRVLVSFGLTNLRRPHPPGLHISPLFDQARGVRRELAGSSEPSELSMRVTCMRTIGVIPARYKSSRLEGKPLADIHGKSMVQHVYERARRASCLDDVVVATDDERIRSVVQSFGGKAVMTSAEHRSGTDRVAEAVRAMDADVVVNIQGDEPMLDPAMLAEVVDPFRSDTSVG